MRSTVLFCLVVAFSNAARSAESPPTFRLGDLATPRGYEARLAASPREDGFTGEIRISLDFNRASPVLWLNATGLAIDSARIAQGTREIEAKVIAGGEDFIGLASPGEPFASGPAVATLRYHGAIENVAARGLFRKRYEDVPYLYTQFEEIDARRAFPCFDEPGWKVPWRLTIDAPAQDVVVSNTPETAASDVPDRSGWRRHEFKATAPLPTYLVALAIGPFDIVDGGAAGRRKTPLRYLVPKGHAAEARLARDNTPRIVETLEEYFDIPYPFEKLDSVAVPQLGGAMENAGMITYEASEFIARPHEETDDNRRRYVSIAAHEIAHQWFGDYMTVAWWDDIWLNEAFATWMGHKTMYAVNPAWDDGYETAWSRRRAIDADRLSTARRIRNPVADKGDIEAAFDGITYNKGAEVLSMFEAGIGPEKFRRGVQLFLRRHAWSSATSTDFFRAVSEASGSAESTMRAFETFTEQSGVPLVEARLQCAKGAATLELTQQRLKPAGSRAEPHTWSTPVCFRYPDAKGGLHMQCTTLAGESGRIELEGAGGCPAWVAGNARGVGHYVTRYESTLARGLARDFRALPPHEAIALLGDEALLSESGLDRIDTAITWAEAGLRHPSRLVQASAITLLDAQQDAWLGAQEARRKRGIIQRHVIPLAGRIGWKPRPGDDRATIRLRGILMPFAAKQEEGRALRAEANALAKAWLADRSAVGADVAPAVMDTAARFADEPMLAGLEEAVRANGSQRDQRTLLKAIAKVRAPGLRDRALGVSIARAGAKDAINGHDAIQMLEFALEDEANRPAAFDFIRTNFDPLVAKAPRDFSMRLIERMGELCTPSQRAQFVEVIGPRASRFVGGEVEYRHALESIDICIAARSR